MTLRAAVTSVVLQGTTVFCRGTLEGAESVLRLQAPS